MELSTLGVVVLALGMSGLVSAIGVVLVIVTHAGNSYLIPALLPLGLVIFTIIYAELEWRIYHHAT